MSGSSVWASRQNGAWLRDDNGMPTLSEALLSPCTGSSRVICIGRNFADHAAEMQSDLPPEPNVFLRNPSSLVAPGTPLRMPPHWVSYDYEGEIGLVIGRGGRDISASDARASIAGLTFVFDGSVRELQKHSLAAGKNVDATGCVGPWIAPLPDLPWEAIWIETCINGEIRQRDNLGSLIFSPEDLIVHISRFMELRDGDIIATGTPAGVGAGHSPPRWLKPGDRIELRSQAIGALHLHVVSTMSQT